MGKTPYGVTKTDPFTSPKPFKFSSRSETPSESLVIGIRRVTTSCLAVAAQDGLPRIVGAAGESRHLHLQGHDIFLLTHVGLDA